VIRYLLTTHRGKAIAGAITGVIALAVLTAFAVLGIVLPGGHGAPPHAAHTVPTPSAGTPDRDPGAGAQGSTVLSAQELAQLDAAPTVAPATAPLLPPVPAQERTQPDLYARAFFTALFAHPYAGVTRGQMLAWIQSQQAATTFITGGSPAQRNRLLVESGSDPAWSNHGFAALPDEATWAQASAGRMSVRIDRLTCLTPPDWEQAIAAGEVTDPGLTERLVSGDITTAWTHGGQRQSQKVSVALTLLLEDPPTAGQYGVVVIADTNAVRVPS
jgi:hypothetical protein